MLMPPPPTPPLPPLPGASDEEVMIYENTLSPPTAQIVTTAGLQEVCLEPPPPIDEIGDDEITPMEVQPEYWRWKV